MEMPSGVCPGVSRICKADIAELDEVTVLHMSHRILRFPSAAKIRDLRCVQVIEGCESALTQPTVRSRSRSSHN